MEKLLIALIVLTTLSFIFMVYGIVEEYMEKRKVEKLIKSALDFETSLNELAIKNLEEKNKVQGIKKITKKHKTTTERKSAGPLTPSNPVGLLMPIPKLSLASNLAKTVLGVTSKKTVSKKPKTTTDMIKVNGKTKVVKRDKKGHFVK